MFDPYTFDEKNTHHMDNQDFGFLNVISLIVKTQ